MPKTASSSIQFTSYSNRELLKEQGVIYPLILDDKNKIKDEFSYYVINKKDRSYFENGIINGHFLLTNLSLLDTIINDFKESDYTKLLLSEEFLIPDNNLKWIDAIFKYKDEFDIYIVGYFRELLSFTISFYKQDNFNNLLKKMSIYNFHIYENFCKNLLSLDREHIIFKPFDKSYFPNGDIMNSFFGKNSSEEVFGDKCYDYWLKKINNTKDKRELTKNDKKEIFNKLKDYILANMPDYKIPLKRRFKYTRYSVLTYITKSNHFRAKADNYKL